MNDKEIIAIMEGEIGDLEEKIAQLVGDINDLREKHIKAEAALREIEDAARSWEKR